MKKIPFIFLFFLLNFPVNSEITSKIILDSKTSGKESINIAVTPLSSKKNIKRAS